jgi:hypothetical protein
MSVTELAFRPDVNVSIASGNGRFSAVDQWPVLGVHRGPTDDRNQCFYSIGTSLPNRDLLRQLIKHLNNSLIDVVEQVA